MNIAKLTLVFIVAAVTYFVFLDNGWPNNIAFRGNTLGPVQEVKNNSTKNFEVFSYNDKTNHHLLLFLKPEDQSVSAQELLDFYVGNFETQGFEFRKSGAMHLGLKGDEVIYMTIAEKMNAAIAYIEKGPEPLPMSPSDANDIFSSLINFSLN